MIELLAICRAGRSEQRLSYQRRGNPLTRSAMPGAEAWAVQGSDGLPDLGEWSDLGYDAQLGRGIDECRVAFRAYIELADDDRATVEGFQQLHSGDEYLDRGELADEFSKTTGELWERYVPLF
jgi:antirestriction protein